MKPKTTHRHLLALAGSSLLAVSSVSAQTTYTWNNTNVTSLTTPTSLNWINPTQANWTNGTPVSDNANTIQFFNNTTTALTNTVSATQASVLDYGSAFELGTLTLSGLASTSGSVSLTMNLSGDALNFSAATGTINLNANHNGARTITYNVANNIQLGTASSASNLTLAGNGTSVFNFSGNFTELQTGTGSKLIKSGTSTATLSGAVTVSGGLEVNGGILSLTGSSNAITGGITLNGGTLDYSVASTINGNNISVNGAATLRTSSNPSTNATITLNPGANLSLSTSNGSQSFSSAVTGDGSLTITRYSSGSGNYILNSTANTFTGGITFANQGNTLQLTVNSLADSASVGAGNIAFAGTNGGTNPSYLFILGSGASAPLTLNNRRIEFTSTSTSGGVLANNSSQAFTINTDLLVSSTSTPTLILRGTGSGLSSFNGLIANGTGTVGLTKSESGTWVLGNSANSYTGTTTIAGGTLIINTLKNYTEASSLGAPTSGDIIFNRSTVGSLIYAGSGNTTNRTIRFEDDVSNRNSGSGIYNNGTGALIFNGSTFNTPFVSSGNTGHSPVFIFGGTFAGSANQIGGVIADNQLSSSSRFAITKNADTSIWQFSGANTYSGGNTISGGSLIGTQTSDTPFGTGAVTINAGILSLAPTGSGSAVSVTGGTRAAGTLFTYNPGAMLSLARGTQNSLTYTFGGTGATTARGTNGTLILSTSDIANFGAAGTNLERFIMNGNAPTQVNTLVSGVVIQDRANSNSGDFATYDATNGFTKASYTHTDTFTGSTNVSRVEITSATATGSIASYAIKANATVTNSGTITLGSSGNPAALILNGGSISGGTLAAANANSEFVIYTSGASSISSAITTSTSGMSLFGPGSLTLSTSNSFIGGLRVNNSTLVVTNDNQLGGANNALTLRGGTLQTSGASLAIGAGARAIVLAVGQDQTGGTFNVSSGTTTFQNNSSSARIISGSGSLTKTGAGILELTGNTTNTYTGGSFVNQGTLRLGNSNMLADTGFITVNGGAFEMQTFSDTVGAVTLTSGSITGTGVLTGSSYNVRSGTVSAILGGSGNLTKSTAGTVTLSAANTYTGTTSVTAGTLLVNNTTGSGTGSGAVNVGANGTLGGSGTIAGSTTIDGFLNPGNSPGVLTFSDSLSLGISSTTTFEIDGLIRGDDYDGVNVGTDLALGGALVLKFGSIILSDATFDLFNITDDTSGNFSTVSLIGDMGSGSFTFDDDDVWTFADIGNTWTFTQSTGKLDLTVIPEPGSALLATMGLLFILRRRRN